MRVRETRLLEYLEKRQPDFLCLQELKCTDDKFPMDAIENLGYRAEIYGQKAYNGVAILHKGPPPKTWNGYDRETPEPDARLIWMEMSEDSLLGSLYVPNGSEVGSEKYTYKLAWLDRLYQYLLEVKDRYPTIILCGDFNIAAEDIDVHDPLLWEDKILCSVAERERLEKIMALDFVDPFRKNHPSEKAFSWWDYRQLAFQKNLGLRIDYTFVRHENISSIKWQAGIDRDVRKGEKPSDHAPVWVEFDEK